MSYSGDNMMGVKRTNRSAALKILHEQGGMSRKRMADSIHLTPAAITKIVGEMISEGLLVEGAALANGGVGRREVLITLNTRSRCALGVLLNLTEATLSGVWLDGSVIFSETIALPRKAPAEETVAALSRRLLALQKEHKLPRESIIGLGIAVRGITSADERSVINSFGTLDSKDFPLCERFESHTGIPCVLANNVRALLGAQMFLARDTSTRSQLFVRCEYGIGAALAINGKIWRGDGQQCAEIGHIPVIRRGGKPCQCGKSGCLETIASPTAIREDTKAIFSKERTPVLWNLLGGKWREDVSLAVLFDAAQNGDEGVGAIVDTAVTTLGSALKSVIYLIDPGKIVLYGSMFDSDYYLSKLLADMREGVDVHHCATVERSAYNHELEDKAAGLVAVSHYFNNGALL